MEPRLSICIPMLSCRREFHDRLWLNLQPQIDASGGQVVVFTDEDNGEAKIGAKRQRLLMRARESAAGWTMGIDDDDEIASDAVHRILAALESNPDCIGFRSTRYKDGVPWAECSYSSRHKRESDEPPLPGELVRMSRWPGHLNPIRTSLCPDFHPWNFSEDRAFAIEVRRKIRSEVFLDAPDIYSYYMRNRAARDTEQTHPERWTETHRPKPTRPLSQCY
jgi:hypothetical protein